MARSSYDECLRRLLAHEGGYTNHPSDPGGPTNFGITIFDYRKYVKPNATAADVRAMKLDEAKAIYRAKYWAAQRCDDLPAGVDYSVFDYGVNSGIGRSGKVLRRVVGLPDNTSVVTDEVLRAVAKRDAEGDRRRDQRRTTALPQGPEDLAGVRRRLGPARQRGASVVACSMASVREGAGAIASSRAAAPAPGKGVGAGAAGAEGSHHQGHWHGRAGAAGGIGFWDWIAAHPWRDRGDRAARHRRCRRRRRSMR